MVLHAHLSLPVYTMLLVQKSDELASILFLSNSIYQLTLLTAMHCSIL